MNEPLMQKIKKLPLKLRQRLLFGLAIFVILGLSGLFVKSSTPTRKFTNEPRELEYSMFNGATARDVSMDAMASKVDSLSKDFTDIRASYQRYDERIREAVAQMEVKSRDLTNRTAELQEQTQQLMQKLEDTEHKFNAKSLGTPTVNFPVPASPPPVPLAIEDNSYRMDKSLKIRIVTNEGDSDAHKNGESTPGLSKTAANSTTGSHSKISEYVNIKYSGKSGGSADMFLPAGSILSGVLVTGLDAPSSNQSRNDPYPVLIRIKHVAILPNRYRMDIKECFLIASGFGDLSTERALIRADRFSCIRKNGTVIETSLDAYSVGEDGKAGVRGRIVSKNGQLIGNAMMSGFIAGISKAFAPQQVYAYQTGNIGSQAQYQYPSPQMLAGQAISGGIKGAAEQIAIYYLELARNIFPVVEIDAGRKIDFVILRGIALKPKNKASANAQEHDNVSNRVSNTSNDYLHANQMLGNEYRQPSYRGLSSNFSNNDYGIEFEQTRPFLPFLH